MQKQLCNKVVDCLNKSMHDDVSNIFNLYLEAVEEQPKMTIDMQGNKEWYLHGKLHRADAPAVEDADGSTAWYLHGKLHRDNGPAVEKADGSTAWYLHGKLHREDAPAVEMTNGHKAWHLHGNLHRKDGPAVEYANGAKAWLLNGKMHREDGPAYEDPNAGRKAWWLHNIHYKTAEAWAEAVLKLHNKPHDDAAVHAFLRTILKKDAEAAL